MHPDNGDIVICEDFIGVVKQYKGQTCLVYCIDVEKEVPTESLTVIINAYAEAALLYDKIKGGTTNATV